MRDGNVHLRVKGVGEFSAMAKALDSSVSWPSATRYGAQFAFKLPGWAGRCRIGECLESAADAIGYRSFMPSV